MARWMFFGCVAGLEFSLVHRTDKPAKSGSDSINSSAPAYALPASVTRRRVRRPKGRRKPHGSQFTPVLQGQLRQRVGNDFVSPGNARGKLGVFGPAFGQESVPVERVFVQKVRLELAPDLGVPETALKLLPDLVERVRDDGGARLTQGIAQLGSDSIPIVRPVPKAERMSAYNQASKKQIRADRNNEPHRQQLRAPRYGNH